MGCLPYHHRAWELPLLVSQLHLIEVWSLFFSFTKYNLHILQFIYLCKFAQIFRQHCVSLCCVLSCIHQTRYTKVLTPFPQSVTIWKQDCCRCNQLSMTFYYFKTFCCGILLQKLSETKTHYFLVLFYIVFKNRNKHTHTYLEHLHHLNKIPYACLQLIFHPNPTKALNTMIDHSRRPRS